jgi:hypothetical protein
MVMYSKTYKSYFNATDDTVYEFKLTLTLGVYGATDEIKIEDAGQTWIFGTDEKGCTVPEGFKLSKKNTVEIDGLPSGVKLQFTCSFPDTRFRLWDVTELIEYVVCVCASVD